MQKQNYTCPVLVAHSREIDDEQLVDLKQPLKWTTASACTASWTNRR